jgi:hypothetical protein
MIRYHHNVIRRAVLARQMAAAEAWQAAREIEFQQIKAAERRWHAKLYAVLIAAAVSPLLLGKLLSL